MEKMQKDFKRNFLIRNETQKRVVIVGIGMKHIVHNFIMNENIFGVSEQVRK